MLGIFPCLCCRLQTISKLTFSKNSFKNTIRVSNNLDPDQDRHFVEPDLGPSRLQQLSADDTSWQRVKPSMVYRGSYMSAHVLLNLLNELGKRDQM